ncbi:MAG TPA: ACT domain-containing protein [Verrucomicrobiae bacterium]|jgi:glycine cleavage system transcriptional repressor|nr:ACT domain-containing protein [Verrucomicrobiae bacterium]
MDTIALISVLCEDNPGLIAAITGRLYDIGANLGDTTFAVLGGAAEFTAVCELPEGVSLASVEAELARLPALASAKLSVTPFGYQPVHADQAHITHRIEITGKDSPGLIARLSEVFLQFGANIVRLNSERLPGAGHAHYMLRMAVFIPQGKASTCLATVANTAAQLALTCWWEES